MAPPAYMCPPPTLSHTSSQPPRFDYFPHDLLMLTSPICPSLKFQKLCTIIQMYRLILEFDLFVMIMNFFSHGKLREKISKPISANKNKSDFTRDDRVLTSNSSWSREYFRPALTQNASTASPPLPCKCSTASQRSRSGIPRRHSSRNVSQNLDPNAGWNPIYVQYIYIYTII